MDDLAARVGLAALLAAIGVAGWLVYRLLFARARLRMQALFKAYFRGEMTADELGERALTTPGRRFLPNSELLALAAATFQSAVDEKLEHKPLSTEETNRLLHSLAALKLRLGLPDLYRSEGWRVGRG